METSYVAIESSAFLCQRVFHGFVVEPGDLPFLWNRFDVLALLSQDVDE